MGTYIGDKFGFVLTEIPVGDTQISLSFSWGVLPAGSYSTMISYRPKPDGEWVNNTAGVTKPRTWTIPVGDYDYQVTVFIEGPSEELVSFTLSESNTNNYLFDPELNPLLFYEDGKVNLPRYFTKHFGDYPFEDRGYYWQDQETYCQPWQTTDIINLQFESTFSPIAVNLLNQYGDKVLELSANNIVPHLYFANTYSYQFNISLAGLPTGIYQAERIAGFGIYQKRYVTKPIYVSETQLDNTVYVEYKDRRSSHKDVMFATGINFGYRVPCTFGKLQKFRKDEYSRDQSYNSSLLNSKSAKQFPATFGRPCGLPDEHINLIHEIFGCDTVTLDNKYFGLAEGSKDEYTDIFRSRKRYMTLLLEEGLNRNSRVFQTVKDNQKRLIVTGMVDPYVWGVSSGTNTIQVTNIE